MSVDDARRREILKLLQDTLQATPGLMAKELARKFKDQGIDKTTINGILYGNRDLFEPDAEYRWVLSAPLKVVIPQGWMTAKQFDNLLTPYTETKPSRIIFEFHIDTRLMFDAIGLLLALSNQLAEANTSVSLDFPTSNCPALTYLCRADFFQQLDPQVVVLPERPTATTFLRNSENLVELVGIHPDAELEDTARALVECFVGKAGKEYLGAAVNVFSELIGNVIEHSQSVGFAGMQSYGKPDPHIQTVVSDRGLGIAGTLRTVDRIRRRFGSPTVANDVKLVRKAVEEGRLSSIDAEARGLGLFRSHDASSRFNAKFSIRQEHFALRYTYRGGKLGEPQVDVGLFPVRGTQICFDYRLP